MADTTFVDGQTVIEAAWLNDVNEVVYNPTAAVIPASSIVNTPYGNIAATDVQTALNELNDDKQAVDADLTAIAALTTAAYGRSLLEVANEAALKTLTNLESGVDVLAYVAPGTSGNVLTSNGSIWASSALAAVGSGQTWQTFTIAVDRVSGTVYQNTTGKPIQVSVSNPTNNGTLVVAVDDVTPPVVTICSTNISTLPQYSFIVPNNHYYTVTLGISAATVWAELR